MITVYQFFAANSFYKPKPQIPMSIKSTLILFTLLLSACATAPVPTVIQLGAPPNWVLKTPPPVPIQNITGLIYHFSTQSDAMLFIKQNAKNPDFKSNLILSTAAIVGPHLNQQEIVNMVASHGGNYYIVIDSPHPAYPKLNNTTVTVRATPSYQKVLAREGYITEISTHFKDY